MNPVHDEVLVAPSGRQIGWHARGPTSGTPVLYLHGWPGSRLEQYLIPEEVLVRFGVRLVSIDRPGWGNTDPLPGERSERVVDALTIFDALGVERFPAVGVSGGGSNVLTLAAVAPGRVARVILVSGQMPHDDDAFLFLDPEEAEYVRLFRLGRSSEIEELCEEDRSQALADTDALVRDLAKGMGSAVESWWEQPWVREVIVREVREGYRRSAEGEIADCVVSTRPLDVDISSIRCPVRAIHGSIDTMCPLPNLTRFLPQIADSRLIILDGMGHFGPLMYPDLLVSVACGAGN